METKNLQNQKGFTLVEIAIVLVIIGLLLGGVLKGQELIENAKVKAVKGDSDALVAAIQGYQDRFRALPGDDPAGNTDDRGAAADGDGSGAIDADEVADAWASLRANGFLGGNGNTAPSNSFGGDVGIKYGSGGMVICNTGLTVEQMELVDIRFDETNDADAGAINYVETGGTDLDADDSSIGVAVVAGELCIGY